MEILDVVRRMRPNKTVKKGREYSQWLRTRDSLEEPASGNESGLGSPKSVFEKKQAKDKSKKQKKKDYCPTCKIFEVCTGFQADCKQRSSFPYYVPM